MLPRWKTADFRFWATVLFRGIVGPIALKRQEDQVLKDAFYTR
jgi:hypothetical protein